MGVIERTLEGSEIDPLAFLEAQGHQWAREVYRRTVDNDLVRVSECESGTDGSMHLK